MIKMKIWADTLFEGRFLVNSVFSEFLHLLLEIPGQKRDVSST